MHILSLNHNELDFKTIEEEIYKIVCKVACETMKDILEQIDLMLLAKRDTEKYRNKGFRKTCIHTLMGEVEYKRRIYKAKNEDGKDMHVYLLDQYLKRDTIGHVSSNLAEKMVENALEQSYRNMGTMESSVCNVIKLRMKGRKMSWTKSGANNLGKLLALRAIGKLYDAFDTLFNTALADDKLEEMVEEIVQLSAAEANKKPKKTGIYPIKTSPMPYEGQTLTLGRKAIRNLTKMSLEFDLR